ncbi:hypothetical protein M9H77_10588 [Catharanthus roseus]|uniref:Uncharacterized protein n=1 Tax=Catharanthus roseus TaxID=4058 RepID=A0ACC0BC76_CATRO|nr:hypothetical protein M9H77_10588 [Catharanthus roseus]
MKSELSDQLIKKKAEMEHMLERTSEVRRMKDNLQQTLQQAIKERIELKGERDHQANHLENLVKHIKSLERQIQDVQELQLKNTQAEATEMEEKLKEIQNEIDEENSILKSLKEEEDSLLESKRILKAEIETITSQIEANERKHNAHRSHIRDLLRQQSNKVTAFGGDKVITLLKVIERHHKRFRRPPIGPIGAHLTLVHGDDWSTAIENALGSLFNAFIVTDHQDSLCLRECAKEAGYRNLRIIIHNFSRPRINIPDHMFPQTHYPTAISELNSDNPTVMNVLIDMGNGERLVLVKDHQTGMEVAFDQRIKNLKEVYTSDGYRIEAQEGRGIKRKKEEALHDLEEKLRSVKRRQSDALRNLRSREFKFRDLKKQLAADATPAPASSVDEFHREINKAQQEIREKKILLEKVQLKLNEALERADNLKASFENLCESAKEDFDAFQKAEGELMEINSDLHAAEANVKHYEDTMQTTALPKLKEAEAKYSELEEKRKENYRKASIICAESEIEELGGCGGRTPEELSSQLSRLNQRLQRESQRFPDSVDDLRVFHENKRLTSLPDLETGSLVAELSGERSFSTLCFTMALHEMTEATFRAMDEFDVFMDAVSRKISLDTLVDFALAQGSQWIFITPHDISMVKQDERVKKQQMAPPRA